MTNEEIAKLIEQYYNAIKEAITEARYEEAKEITTQV